MAFFEKFADDLEDDEYVIHPNYYGIVPVCDLDDELDEIGFDG